MKHLRIAFASFVACTGLALATASCGAADDTNAAPPAGPPVPYYDESAFFADPTAAEPTAAPDATKPIPAKSPK